MDTPLIPFPKHASRTWNLCTGYILRCLLSPVIVSLYCLVLAVCGCCLRPVWTPGVEHGRHTPLSRSSFRLACRSSAIALRKQCDRDGGERNRQEGASFRRPAPARCRPSRASAWQTKRAPSPAVHRKRPIPARSRRCCSSSSSVALRSWSWRRCASWRAVTHRIASFSRRQRSSGRTDSFIGTR